MDNKEIKLKIFEVIYTMQASWGEKEKALAEEALEWITKK